MKLQNLKTFSAFSRPNRTRGSEAVEASRKVRKIGGQRGPEDHPDPIVGHPCHEGLLEGRRDVCHIG